MKDSSIRIVSLIPSGTEILAALGLTDAIVGRSHECDYPPEIQNRPICTKARLNSNASSQEIDQQVNNLLQSAVSIYEINTEILQQVKPTHIVTQDQCDVCAVSLQEVEKAVANLIDTSPQIISLQPNLLADVWQDIERVGNIFEVDSVKLLEDLEARVKICQQRIQGLSLTELPTVACIEWIDPLMVGANWIPELVNLVGGQSLFSSSGQPSATITWETLVASNPDVIIFMPCGWDLQRTRQEARLLTKLPEWQGLHAVQTGRVYITDGNAYFNRPGPRLVDSLEILAEMLHPEIFAYGYKGTAWEVLAADEVAAMAVRGA
ncbi:cobalamin-binding protein [Calothrix sp. FACHB-1219]|uniref:cobalamin-binding protein n=1 Tax=unclassified Calothrix TaxID=2619626 RepID=UPI0016889C84|nr:MULTISPECIES: cobalamin-binding protein [unclassified Calothrix]MBD2204701.1 cobalamin-binding protein [Calothrix sp. FACHB-168]MBD2216787.1 cobalamin-binding protein [Calothrix sp. FACHB-1219]